MNSIKKLKKHHFSCLIMAMLLLNAAFAEEKEDDKFPLGCKDLGYQFRLKVLEILPEHTGDRQSLYFVYNTLSEKINLYQMRGADSTQTTYLNHTINPKQWSVLSTSEKHLRYACTIDDAHFKYGKLVDCEKSVKVCEYARVKYGLNNKGNYWLVNSNTKNGSVRDVVRYGIIPR